MSRSRGSDRRRKMRRRNPQAEALNDPRYAQRVRPGREYDRKRAEREARRHIQEEEKDDA